MKIADRILYCSACRGQYLDRQHVDFEAYYDGPVITEDEVIEGVKTYTAIDDLVLCEKCLRGAGELIGLFPAEELKKENEELGEAVELAHQQVIERDELISDLQHTIKKLSDDTFQRPQRRPKMVAVD